jgi:hypothetical protein
MIAAFGVDERIAAARYIGVGEASSPGGALVVVLAIVKLQAVARMTFGELNQ